MAETNVLDHASEQRQMGQGPGLQTRLSVMMFLQYAVWGLWAPILGLHLGNLKAFQLPGATPGTTVTDFWKVGLIYMTMPIASIIGPFIAGQIADRYFAAQRFLALSNLLGGVVLLVVARLTGFYEVFFGMVM